MKDLKKKTFLTIFLIFTSFLLIITIFTNFQNYTREYNNLKNNLLKGKNIFYRGFKPNEFEVGLVMDYELYTVLFDSNNNIVNIFRHTNETTNFDIENIASNIIKTKHEGTYEIKNLYFSNYAYRFDNDSLTVINTQVIRDRLINYLLLSIGLFITLEIIVLFITKIITNYLTKPAMISFEKQKEFIADASHELKTPVAVIMASTDALENDYNIKYLNNIKNETERMNKLITSLLDLSKLESGVSKNTYKIENISKIIEKATLTFESIAYEKNVLIDTSIEDNIMLKCSGVEINELMSILLDNAIKHSYKNTNINVILNNNKNDIRLEVINTGDEIKKEDEEKIFERFYRIDKGRNRSVGRYGLGLAIAKNIVLNHNGKISAYSHNGKTTFEVILKK